MEDKVTYKTWYEANLNLVQQLKDFQKQINVIKDEQPELIKGAIKEHVNGKIDRLTNTLNEYIRQDTERNLRKDEEFARRDAEDQKWKKEFGPYVKGLQYLTLGGKILVMFALGVTAVIGALYAIKQFFVKL